ncbi:MAG: hypothetical protein IPF60_12490 [Betaproteobacteria bacterium]|nr:hypothetical protein [Betaproteobacteria bacterium]
MELPVAGERCYVYTGGRASTWQLPTVVSAHGAANDSSVRALQSRHLMRHGRSVLAVDLPGHGHFRPGRRCRRSRRWRTGLPRCSTRLASTLRRWSVTRWGAGGVAGRGVASGAVTRTLLGPAMPMTVSDSPLELTQADDLARWR